MEIPCGLNFVLLGPEVVVALSFFYKVLVQLLHLLICKTGSKHHVNMIVRIIGNTREFPWKNWTPLRKSLTQFPQGFMHSLWFHM